MPISFFLPKVNHWKCIIGKKDFWGEWNLPKQLCILSTDEHGSRAPQWMCKDCCFENFHLLTFLRLCHTHTHTNNITKWFAMLWSYTGDSPFLSKVDWTARCFLLKIAMKSQCCTLTWKEIIFDTQLLKNSEQTQVVISSLAAKTSIPPAYKPSEKTNILGLHLIPCHCNKLVNLIFTSFPCSLFGDGKWYLLRKHTVSLKKT